MKMFIPKRGDAAAPCLKIIGRDGIEFSVGFDDNCGADAYCRGDVILFRGNKKDVDAMRELCSRAGLEWSVYFEHGIDVWNDPERLAQLMTAFVNM